MLLIAFVMRWNAYNGHCVHTNHTSPATMCKPISWHGEFSSWWSPTIWHHPHQMFSKWYPHDSILFLLANMKSTLHGSGPSSPIAVLVPVYILGSGSQFTYVLGSRSQFTCLGLGPSSPTCVWVPVHLLGSGSQFTYLGPGLSWSRFQFTYLGLGLSSPT